MKKVIISVSFYLVASLILQIQLPQNAYGEASPDTKHEDIKKGKRIYSVSCVLCHGSKGKGDGPASVFIGPYSHPRPANFTMENFKFRTTESGELPTLKDLMRTISYGIPGYMPSFKHLDEDGIRQVALYLSETFLEDDLRVKPDQLPPKPPEVIKEEAVASREEDLDAFEEDIFEEEMSRTLGADPDHSLDRKSIRRIIDDLSKTSGRAMTLAYQPQQAANNIQGLVSVLQQINRDAEVNADRIKLLEKDVTKDEPFRPDASRGKEIFHEMQCISCHGVNGKGHEADTNMKDERGFHIMAADLTQPSSFGNGNTRKDIFRTVMTGLNGTPMPSFSDLFVGEEDRAWDLVEYVYSLQEDALARFLP